MADRFPSLDAFDAGQTSPQEAGDPSDFLSRERAALGDDAQLFASTNDATVEEDDDDDDDLLGGGDSGGGQQQEMHTNSNNDMMSDFESSFPDMSSTNEAVGAGGTITGSSTLPYHTHQSTYQPTADEEEEPEVLRTWRNQRDQQIARRDEVSASKKAETVKAAQESVDEFYENYNNRKDKVVAQTRKEAETFMAGREDTTSGGTSWERIAKLVDLSGKGATSGGAASGKARMRELLVSLRKDEHAPGSTGV